MKKLISRKTAGIVLIISLSLLMVFHLLVIFGMFPQDIVWGGHMEEENIKGLEIFSLALTAFFIVIATIKVGYVKNRILRKIAGIVIWVMVIYFSLNIVGNVTAKTLVENAIFTPLSTLMVICSIRLAMKN